MRFRAVLAGMSVLAAALGVSCSRRAAPASRTIVLGAYTVPKEAYEQRIIPAFKRHWKEKTGQEIDVQASYVGSGAQARAIAAGFEADVAALSLEGDVDMIREAGLIAHDWKANAWGGMVTRSIVVIGARSGNPKGIRDWRDLARPDVEVVTPDPSTSGGAMWNVSAVWGAGLLGPDGGEGEARLLLAGVRARVKALDPSGRESMTTFERGVGDAVITYENEVLLRRKQGREYHVVVPAYTIRIDNPVAIVDRSVDRHGNRDLVEGFVAFLRGEEAQRAFVEYGFRSVLESIEAETRDLFPHPERLFTIDDLGGWKAVREKLFSPDGIWAQVNREAAAR